MAYSALDTMALRTVWIKPTDIDPRLACNHGKIMENAATSELVCADLIRSVTRSRCVHDTATLRSAPAATNTDATVDATLSLPGRRYRGAIRCALLSALFSRTAGARIITPITIIAIVTTVAVTGALGVFSAVLLRRCVLACTALRRGRALTAAAITLDRALWVSGRRICRFVAFLSQQGRPTRAVLAPRGGDAVGRVLIVSANRCSGILHITGWIIVAVLGGEVGILCGVIVATRPPARLFRVVLRQQRNGWQCGRSRQSCRRTRCYYRGIADMRAPDVAPGAWSLVLCTSGTPSRRLLGGFPDTLLLLATVKTPPNCKCDPLLHATYPSIRRPCTLHRSDLQPFSRSVWPRCWCQSTIVDR
eukprot:m.1226825 g.1226825  ORF g.1226825 m.1226825 type:complete len:363 (+) comp24640_c0_seq5:2275-3363(+)